MMQGSRRQPVGLSKELANKKSCLVVGVLNVTPDSFSDGAFGSAAVADEDDNFENLFGDAPASSGHGDVDNDGEDDGDLDVPDFLR